MKNRRPVLPPCGRRERSKIRPIKGRKAAGRQPHVKPQCARCIGAYERTCPICCVILIDSPRPRMYTARRLERWRDRAAGDAEEPVAGRGFSRPPGQQPAAVSETHSSRRAVSAAFFSGQFFHVASRPPRARERQSRMSTAIEPNAQQGSSVAFEITGAAPAPADTLGLNARRVIAKRY